MQSPEVPCRNMADTKDRTEKLKCCWSVNPPALKQKTICVEKNKGKTTER